MLLDLVAQAPDEETLAVIGAGPLEDFLAGHAAAYLTRIESASARDPRFRKVLGSTWIWDVVPARVFERLARAAGSELDRPRTGAEAASRRRSSARLRELVEPLDALAASDSTGDSEELHRVLRELDELLGREPRPDP